MVMFALLGVELIAAVAAACARSTGWQRVRTLLLVTGACALCGLVNPRGVEAYRYAFLLLGHQDMLNYIQEWWSPNFQDRLEKPLGYLLLLLACAGGGRRRHSLRDLLLLVGLLHAALISHRHVPLFAIGCAPILAERLVVRGQELRRWLVTRRWPGPVWRAAASLTLTLLLSVCLVRQAEEVRLLDALRDSAGGAPTGSWFSRSAGLGFFPIHAVEFLSAQPVGGRLFNDYGWGGYCGWRLWPKYQVFIDGRAEVFFNTSYFDYQQITRLEPGWQEKLRRWKVDTMLVSAGEALAGALAQEPGWRLIYRDKRAVIYRRADLSATTPVESERLQKQEVST
jgi:hypothetical protein